MGMYKLNFLRPRKFKKVKSSAYIMKNGLRCNSDGTSITDRKPNILVMPNHKEVRYNPAIIFNIGTAFRDKETFKLRESTSKDYGTKKTPSKYKLCPQPIDKPKKMHKSETFEQFRLRRRKSNKIRRERESI